MDALRMEGVMLDHPGRPGVLRGVGLRVGPGDLVVVEGRSGSGKSSLLTLAAGLRAPTAGSIHLFGEPLDANDPGAAQLRARHVGLVFQHLHLLPELDVAENIELPLLLARWPRTQRAARVSELMARFGITALAARHPTTLSGGEQQRVAICRALAPRPGLLLVDEPTSSLDETNARAVLAALQAAAASGAAVLVASHDEVLRARGTLYRLDQGRLVQVRA